MGHEYAAPTFIMNSSYNGTHLAEVTAEDRMPKMGSVDSLGPIGS